MLQHHSTQAKRGAALGLDAHMRKAEQFAWAWHPSVETGPSSMQRPSGCPRPPAKQGRDHVSSRAPACRPLPAHSTPGDAAFGGRSLDRDTPHSVAVPSQGVPNPPCFSWLGRAVARCSEDSGRVEQTLAKPWLALQHANRPRSRMHVEVCVAEPLLSPAGTLLREQHQERSPRPHSAHSPLQPLGWERWEFPPGT